MVLKRSTYRLNFIIVCSLFFLGILVIGCSGNQNSSENLPLYEDSTGELKQTDHKGSKGGIVAFKSKFKRHKIKLGHVFNTFSHEYLPIISSDGKTMYFSAMDRTGFFDFKLDFTKSKSSGGEDIFISHLIENAWQDARPLSVLNTNSHEVVSHVFTNDDLIVTANYSENLGAGLSDDAGKQSTDIFIIRNVRSEPAIQHLPEPINTIYTEADGVMNDDENFIIFVSDRPTSKSDYHKKGWKWNESFWGNTDVYVSLKEGDSWSDPVSLGIKVNTPFAERSPWISADGLTLFLSSNGYVKNKLDLDIYAFTRKDKDVWTEWEGPFKIDDACTELDDWGYKETLSGEAYMASADILKYQKTQQGANGDGGVRETNFRPGYRLYGLQTASFNKNTETNIYFLKNTQKPIFLLADVFFEFNSSNINRAFLGYLLLFADQLKENPNREIFINGYTDNIGNDSYNKQLSLKRAIAVEDFFRRNGVQNKMQSFGFGFEHPLVPNDSPSNRRKNRRIEIVLK
jgi:outer membrane protein OmpA-like peptidoglycan-associated protein